MIEKLFEEKGQEIINEVNKVLSEKENNVLEKLILGYNLSDISKMLNVSRSRVGQIREDIQKKYLKVTGKSSKGLKHRTTKKSIA